MLDLDHTEGQTPLSPTHLYTTSGICNVTDLNLSEGTIAPIFVSVKEAARALSISPWSCYQLLDKGVIDSRYQGRRRLVVVESLRAYAGSLPTYPTTEQSA